MANIFFCCFNLVDLGTTGISIAQAGVRLAVLVSRKRQFEARVKPRHLGGFPVASYGIHGQGSHVSRADPF